MSGLAITQTTSRRGWNLSSSPLDCGLWQVAGQQPNRTGTTTISEDCHSAAFKREVPPVFAWQHTSRSQDVVPRRPGLPQSEQRSPCGKVGTRRPAGRRHDGPLCRLRTAHPGPVPPQRAGQSLARQVRPVLRVQLQPHREVLLQGRKALLQNGLFQVTESLDSDLFETLLWFQSTRPKASALDQRDNPVDAITTKV